MIKLTQHLWSRLYPDQSNGLGFEIQDIWESAKEELPHSTDHIKLSLQSQSNIGNIVMHDVNIEETKLKTSGLTLSLYSWSD